MGIIRKTASVGTLGIISFRSKKEKLRRADKARVEAETALETEHLARVAAESLGKVADRKVKRASAAAEKAERKLDKARQKSGRSRRAKKLAALMANAEPLLRTSLESARSVSSDAADRGRKRGRKARKTAKRARREAAKSAAHTYRDLVAAATSAKEAVAPQVEKVVHRASEKLDQLSSR